MICKKQFMIHYEIVKSSCKNGANEILFSWFLYIGDPIQYVLNYDVDGMDMLIAEFYKMDKELGSGAIDWVLGIENEWWKNLPAGEE